MSRFRFALRWTGIHLLLSLAIATVSAGLVFGLLYPMPYREMLGVADIFWLILLVDVVCGPLMTLVLANPRKKPRERLVDWGAIGLIQVLALFYGLHSVWIARPVILAFEMDRLVVVTAIEVDIDKLKLAPQGMQRLPWVGIMHVGTRSARDSAEIIENVELAGGGISPAMLPHWWRPWQEQASEIKKRSKPLSELTGKRPNDAATLQRAAARTRLPEDELRYLPLVSSKTMDWIALLDKDANLVGWAAVDGF